MISARPCLLIKIILLKHFAMEVWIGIDYLNLVYETGWIDLPCPLPHPPLHPKHHCTIAFLLPTHYKIYLITYKKNV